MNNDQPVVSGVLTPVRAAVLYMLLLQPPGLAHICGKRDHLVGGGSGQEAAAPGAHVVRCREMRMPREKGSVQHLAAFSARPPTKLLV